MTGPINMNGQSISGLNDPVEDNQAARKGYVDASISKTNLLDNPWFTINQRGANSASGGYGLDRWIGTYTVSGNTVETATLLQQRLELEALTADSEITISVLHTDGTITSVTGTLTNEDAWSVNGVTGSEWVGIARRSAYWDFRLTNVAKPIQAIKLEYGSVSTLAND